LVERRDEVLDQRVELAGSHAHPIVGLGHAPAGVRARTAAGVAYLVGQHGLETGDIGPGELAVDPGIPCAAAHEVFDDRIDGAMSAEPVIERGLHRASSFQSPLLKVARSPSMKAALSESDRRASGWARGYWIGGSAPASTISAASDSWPGVHSERFMCSRPSFTSRWTSHDIGAMLLYQGHLVSLLWQSKHAITPV